MDEADPRLLSGERIVFTTKKHWFAPVADSATAVLLIIAALILAWLQTEATTGVIGFANRVMNLAEIALFLVGVGMIIYNIVAWRSANYTVTNRRLMGQEGLLRRRETDSLLSSISDVRMRQSAVGRAMGFGDIHILSSSGEAGSDKFTTVLNAVDLKKQILEQKVADGQSQHSAPEPAAAPAAAIQPASAQADTMATLTGLAGLRDAGAITPEEYESKKAELLARI